MNIIQNYIHRSTKKDYLNLLIAPFEGDFEFNLANLGHNLFIVGSDSKIDKYCDKNKKPSNITFFPTKDTVKVSLLISFDLLIINGRINIGIAEQLSPFYQMPVILVEHDKPDLHKWQKKRINKEILNKSFVTMVSYKEDVFNHWNNTGILIKEDNEWQKLFYNLTLGGFKYDERINTINENINNL